LKSTLLSDKGGEKTSTTLPPDVHYNIAMLGQLFNKPNKRIVVRLPLGFRPLSFCLPINSDFGFLQVLKMPGGSFPGGFGGPEVSGDSPTSWAFDDDDGGGFDDWSPSTSSAMPAGDFGDDEFDLAPQISTLAINYAKKAKRVDVKKLKTNIWKELCTTMDPETEDPVQAEHMPEQKSFQAMLSDLPNVVPEREMTDISVPFCFICLLHLANEKNLAIEEVAGDLLIAPK
jgi:condensin complex subunit 2